MATKKVTDSFIKLLMYMNDPKTPKPLTPQFKTEKDAKLSRMEFYAFRRSVLKNPQAFSKGPVDPEFLSAIANMEKIEVRLRKNSLEFDIKDEEAAASAFDKAFEAGGFNSDDPQETVDGHDDGRN